MARITLKDIKPNDTALISRITTKLKEICKKPDELHQIIQTVGEYNSNYARDKNARPPEIVISLGPTANKQIAQDQEKIEETPKPASSQQRETLVMRVDNRAIELMLSSIQDPEGGHLYKDIIEWGSKA
jgi:hypothetical protein